MPPEADGSFDVDRMLNEVDRSTILVACMMVNNETGARCDVERLAREAKKINPRVMVHVDGVQAWMRLPVKLADSGIDSFTVSGHKIHAPKGVGGLFLTDKLIQSFKPPYLGGEQEREIRPGTENLPYILGLAAAAQKLAPTMKQRTAQVQALNDRLRAGLAAFPPWRSTARRGRCPRSSTSAKTGSRARPCCPGCRNSRCMCPRRRPAAGASPATPWLPWAAAPAPSTPPSGFPSAPTTPPRTWTPSWSGLRPA